MLAGMQDALDHAEHGENILDAQATEKDASRVISQPLGGAALPAPSEPAEAAPATQEPHAIDFVPPPCPETTLSKSSTTGADRIREVMRNETQPLDPFEERLVNTNPQLNDPYRGNPPRKRGRPRKNPEK